TSTSSSTAAPRARSRWRCCAPERGRRLPPRPSGPGGDGGCGRRTAGPARSAMAKAMRYVCQSCGAATSKWSGRCDACGAWNTLIEESPGGGAGPAAALPRGKPVELVGLTGSEAEPERTVTGIAEFDRVTGGGLVPGSVLLVGGDPGIGKSTLLLQALAALGLAGRPTVYMSGEESIAQVRLRAGRLGVATAPVALATETNLANILATLQAGPVPAAVVIDSVQTVWSPA